MWIESRENVALFVNVEDGLFALEDDRPTHLGYPSWWAIDSVAWNVRRLPSYSRDVSGA